MPRDKYRVHEVAKDFGMSSKEIIAILEKHSDEPRKHSTALEDKELNIIFDTLTKNTEVDSFDAFFAAGEKAKAEKAEVKTEEVKEEVKAEPVKSEKPAKKTEAKEEKKAPAKKEAPKAEKPQAKEAPKAPEKKASVQQSKPQQNQQPKKEKSDKLQARTKGEKRHVDTRSSNVDLEKYNEKYDEMASQGGRRDNDMGAGKQKLKQKSQQYRKQGMRSNKRETEAEKLKRIAAEEQRRLLQSKSLMKSPLASLQKCSEEQLPRL